MTLAALTTFLVAMVTITNPIGNLAIFTGLTADRQPAEQRKTALKAGLAIGIILLVVTWIGRPILNAFGITLPAFETAGGVIIAMLGLSMLHTRTSSMQHTKDEGQEAMEKEDVAVVPMAIPIVAGPGAITTIVIATQRHGSLTAKIEISAVCVVIAGLLALCFFFAAPISRRLGVAGLNIATRIMGMVLTAIAIQMIATGLKGLFPSLT